MANSLWVGAVRTGLSTARPTVPDFPSDTFGYYHESDTGIVWFGASGGSWTQAFTITAADGTFTGATGVTTSTAPAQVRKLTLTVAAVEVAVTDANDYGSAALVTLPDSNLLVVGCEVDLELTKDGTGYIAGTDLDVALGTAAASNTTLSGTMLDILPKVDLNDSDLTPALQSHSLATTPVLTGILDGASNVIYLNVSGPTETSEDATVTADGSVYLYYIDLGNETS